MAGAGAGAALAAIRALFAERDRVFSRFRAYSERSRVNRGVAASPGGSSPGCPGRGST